MTSLTADWTGAVNGVTFGQGTNYRWRPTGFSGLALPGFRTTDMSRGPQVAGVSSSFDTIDGRLLVFPITIGRATATLTQQNFQTLKAAFKPSTSDTTLDLRVPGMPETQMLAYGRPRGISDEQWEPHGRTMSCVASFLCTDPFFYGAAAAISADSSSPIPIVNAGDASTRRCTLTVVGSGGTPVITNPNVGHITFSGALSGTATIDLDAQTVTVASASREDLVDPSSTWFTIAAGTNNVTFTGCTSVASSTRPAYH